jgi:hypothetical protein
LPISTCGHVCVTPASGESAREGAGGSGYCESRRVDPRNRLLLHELVPVSYG